MRDATRRWVPAAMAGWLAVLLVGCGGGGSGSTGLVTSEGSVVDDVRSTGTCEDFQGTPYCATDSPDATAPGGQSVSVGTSASPTPVPTPTPPGSMTPGTAATPTGAGAQPTATPAAPTSATAAPPSPAPTAGPGDERSVTASVDGFAPGAACAAAARAAGRDDAWSTGALVAVDPAGGAVAFPLPEDVVPPRDVALVCFDDPPAALAPELPTLADADPTVVFVLPGR